MGYRVLAVAVAAVHFGYLGYVTAGGFLGWRWARAVVPHLFAVAWGFAVVVLPWNCPLTRAENWARRRAGEPALASGFIDHYIEGVWFPERYSPAVRVLIGLIVVVSWLGVYVSWQRRRHRPQ